MSEFVRGQRWISEMEPELGLGTIMEVANRRVKILFTGTNEVRLYSIESAPLKRVRFRKGEKIMGQDQQPFTIESVRESGGLIVYLGEGIEMPEHRLSDTISFSKAEDRLMAGQGENLAVYNLRRETHRYRHAWSKSPVRGFSGGRIDLIDHQLYIASEVAARVKPRVLLADEVGLGKTIEAGLVLHRLITSGMCGRVVILTPESLVHQWIVEMLRRFNLWFTLLDAEALAEAEAGEDPENPFTKAQLVIAPLDVLAADSAARRAWLAAGEWDMVVVDEAHHLSWTPEEAGPQYTLVESLAQQSPGLLLLTATPEQLGRESHFARLRLLDPERYPSLQAYRSEAQQYEKVAAIADKLLEGKLPGKSDEKVLARLFKGSTDVLQERIEAMAAGDASARQALVKDLLDRHGVGRVMFRNTRAAMSGFPERKALPAALNATADEATRKALAAEFRVDIGKSTRPPKYDFTSDPRLEWLVKTLRSHKQEKFLLICRSKEKALAIAEALRSIIKLKMGLFHEDLPLIQRDRNAAYFAEEDGARILICSEIGSEGRNFQFAHNLILFDLPPDPELLEQRIGRLDRIGQSATIGIHIPYIKDSAQEILFRWYHEGLNAFEQSTAGGNRLLAEFGARLFAMAEAAGKSRLTDSEALSALLEESRSQRLALAERLHKGRDRLLELNSWRPERAAELREAIAAADNDPALPDFCRRLCEYFGVHVEEIAPRTIAVRPERVHTDAFPTIPQTGLSLTSDRDKALAREDIGFLSWEHPLLTGAMDLLTGSERGNCCFCFWPDSEARTIYLEAIYILECVAPRSLAPDRFLPPTPIRIVVNQLLEDSAEECNEESLQDNVNDGLAHRLLHKQQVHEMLLPRMLAKVEELTQARVEQYRSAALTELRERLQPEIERLRSLQQVNDHVRDAEIQVLEEQLAHIAEHLKTPRLRLDALRLIWRGPVNHPLVA